jgi:hypothetical protein
MKQVKALTIALCAVVVLGCLGAASAMAGSPTVLFLAEEGGLPIKIESVTDSPNNGILSELQNAAGSLKGKGLKLTATVEAASSGKFVTLFLEVNKAGAKCQGEGFAVESGLVQVTGNFTLVHDISATEGGGVLFEPAEVKIECGATKIKITGKVLGLIEPVGGGEKTTGISGKLHCSTTVGEPKEVNYWDSANAPQTALLLANFGTGFKKACEEVAPGTPELSIALTATKMVELMN